MSVLVINFYSAPGGAERRFVRTINYMLDRNQQIVLLINSIAVKELENVGVKINSSNVIKLKDNLFFGRITAYTKILFVLKLWWVILINKFKHIHYPVDPSYITLFHSLVGRFFRVSYSISVVDSMHANKNDFKSFTWFVWRKSIASAVRLDCLSYGIEKNIRKLFDNLPNIEVSPCSFTDYDKSSISSVKDYDVVFMGRLFEGKGIDLFFDALEILKNKKNDTLIKKVGIFGSGPLHSHILSRSQRVPELNIEIGFSKNPFEVFSRTKIFVSLQEKENYPSQSLLEAISCGAFVVATNVGETYRIVSDDLGYLIPALAEDLAFALTKGLERIRDNDFDCYVASSNIRKSHNIERFSEYLSGFLNRAACMSE